MKTLEKKVEFVYDEKELGNLMKQFIKEAESFIEKNDYYLSDESKKTLYEMGGIIWKSYLQNASKRTKKRTNKYIDRFRKKQTLRSLNLLFNFIDKKVLATKSKIGWWGNATKSKSWTENAGLAKIKVLPPLKHQQIQEAKKKWKEAQKIANELHMKYKEEKGDYYKLRLSEGKKI